MASTESKELALAYRTTDAVEARSLAAELADAGVETHIVGDYRDMAYTGITIGSMSVKWTVCSRASAMRLTRADPRYTVIGGIVEFTIPSNEYLTSARGDAAHARAMP